MSLITNSDIVASFNSNVRNYISSQIHWSSSNYPDSHISENKVYQYLGSSYLDTLSFSKTGVVTASDVQTAIASIARHYTRIRQLQYVHYENYGINGGISGTRILSDSTNMAAMNSSYAQSISSDVDSTVKSGQLAYYPSFNNLISNWRNLSYNTVRYSYTTYNSYASHKNGRSKR